MFEEAAHTPPEPRDTLEDQPPPPPCGGKAYREKHRLQTEPGAAERAEAGRTARPIGRRFDAELDLAEIDERGRPGPAWVAKSRSLSRSNLVVLSRRMCYPGREVIVAVHLIDDEPTPLFGRVHLCEYEGEGLYLVDLQLLPTPNDSSIRAWLADRARQAAGT